MSKKLTAEIDKMMMSSIFQGLLDLTKSSDLKVRGKAMSLIFDFIQPEPRHVSKARSSKQWKASNEREFRRWKKINDKSQGSL